MGDRTLTSSRAKRIRVAGVCTLLLTLAACTGSFFYNRLDTLAGWYLGSLVSLTDGQRIQLQHWLSQTLAWHRQSELNRYSRFLRDLSDQVMQPGTPVRYEETQKRFQGFWDDLIEKATPDATTLLLSLSPEQVDELVRNMEEKARERSDDEGKPENWHREQAKSLTRFVKRWAGSVTDEQKALITAAAAQVEPTRDEWLASQQAWQRSLREALQKPADDRAGAVQRLLEKPDNQWTQEYHDKSQRNRQRYLELVTSLDATFTDRQRQHLRAELLKLAQQLDTIARGKT
ncbi:DUF6279 family lipoprotein [Povalibacter uvarum]|uniref:DUF6279 family lipoprotein n=1 Tax=Povalibacter uvarum TaxID=732238 RepID=UPI0016152693|nr:DUF6279 family lipoprotein [Povalibacter uvarum]